MKLDAYGKKLEVIKEANEWAIYEIGEGKKTRSYDIFVPSDYTEEQIILYLEDLFHEAVTRQNPRIKIIG